jgi:hypothetical protein
MKTFLIAWHQPPAPEGALGSRHPGPVVFVKGDIQEGDDVSFRNVTAKLPANQTLVVMTSEGGEIGPGINIGEIIRAKRFSTIALNVCASTCGAFEARDSQAGKAPLRHRN